MQATQTIGSPLLWGGFLLFVLMMLALDLGVFHRKAHAVSMKEAAIWSSVWVALAAVFALSILALFGRDYALEFSTGYLLEKALAVDNIFVFIVIFSAFGIPASMQHRVLFWGVLGALALRAAFIFAGGVFLQRFQWATFVFGALLVATGAKLLVCRDHDADPQRNLVVRFFRWIVPARSELAGGRFTLVQDGRRYATPLLTSLIAVEVADIVFAVDSIPAIFAITRDPFIVFTSNIFAILGLRSMYFLLAGVIERFQYLHVGLALILAFVGGKMLLAPFLKIPIGVSLAVIAGILATAVGASILWPRRARVGQQRPAGH